MLARGRQVASCRPPARLPPRCRAAGPAGRGRPRRSPPTAVRRADFRSPYRNPLQDALLLPVRSLTKTSQRCAYAQSLQLTLAVPWFNRLLAAARRVSCHATRLPLAAAVARPRLDPSRARGGRAWAVELRARARRSWAARAAPWVPGSPKTQLSAPAAAMALAAFPPYARDAGVCADPSDRSAAQWRR